MKKNDYRTNNNDNNETEDEERRLSQSVLDIKKSKRILLQGNGGTEILKGLLELLGVSLVQTLLDNLGCTLDKLLGLWVMR